MSTEPNRAAPYVFLSYASADREKTLHIADLLEANGIPVWIDRKSIGGGTSWGAEIVRGIRGSTVCVLACSPRAVASSNVHQEVQVAFESRRPLVPLILEPADLTDTLVYVLAGQQWIDVLDLPDTVWLPRVIRALSGLGVGAATGGSPSAPRAALPHLGGATSVPRPRPRHNVSPARTSRSFELYMRATDQLGSNKLEARRGAISTLTDLADNSESDYWRVMDVFTTFVRENAPWKAPYLAVLDPRPPDDIQVVLTFLGRSKWTGSVTRHERLDLHETDLRGVDLPQANLAGANLAYSALCRANLREARLEGANLEGADLSGSNLENASLTGANLLNAKLLAVAGLTSKQVRTAMGYETADLPDFLKDLQGQRHHLCRLVVARFERGHMLWRQDTGMILILYDNGSVGSYRDTFTLSDPQKSGLDAPPGFEEPVRGFGKVWRENPELRTRIGWQCGYEQGIDGIVIEDTSSTVLDLLSLGRWIIYEDTFKKMR